MKKEDIYYEIINQATAEKIIQLYKQANWWEETEHARAIIPHMIQGSFCFIVAKAAGEIIGMGRVISDGFSDGYIQDLVVHQNYRNQGIGKEIVSRLVNFCLEKKLESIFLIAEPHTGQFYKKLGFTSLTDFEPMTYG